MRKITVITLSAAALAALACGSGAATTSSGGSNGDGKTTAAAVKIGTPVRDGKFEFTVTSVKCGVTSVGDSILGTKAQGQFCLVALKVTNIGKEPQYFSDDNQKAFGTDKSQYSADSEAGMYANGDNQVLLNEINPGNSVTGTVVFDVPKTAKLASLQLHDSAFSGGVTVNVG